MAIYTTCLINASAEGEDEAFADKEADLKDVWGILYIAFSLE